MRLINADTLEQILFDNIRGGYLTRQEIANNKAIIDIMQLIYEQPTVDAEPAIRCRDCKHHTDEKPGMVYCPELVGGWIEEECYCSWAEPKSELIRCKYCRHYDGYYCHNKNWGDGYGNYTPPIKREDGFCDWADRRKE